MNGEGEQIQTAHHDLFEVMQADADFQEKAEQALALGVDYLGVDNGHVTRIDPQSNYWEAIASTDPETGAFPLG